MGASRKAFPRLLAVTAALLGDTGGVTAAEILIYRGMCDASAIVAAGSEHFVVADDEDNILRVYSRIRGDVPVSQTNLNSFLRVDPNSPEVDLEGAAALGDRVYWVSSHARNKSGKARFSRHRFFATTVTASNGVVAVNPIGLPYVNLLADLLNEPRLKQFNLAAASRRAPKTKNALNIEGLCATPEDHLLIGFRNPIPQGKALLVPLLNPEELVAGKSARFGAPLLLDLGGLGIRSIARSGDRYFIIAGSYDGAGPSSLYEWSGGAEAPRRLPRSELAGLNPEAIECLPENDRLRLLIVSDDGTRKIGGEDCKDVLDPNLKYFRATTLDL